MSNSPFRKPVLPKERPEASDPRWKRWKMHDFAAPRRPLRPRIEADEQSSSAASSAAAQAAAQEAEAERLRHDAQQQGLQIGLQQGEKQGYDVGFQQGLTEGRTQGMQQAMAEQQPMLDTWRTLSAEFQRSLNSLDSVIAARLMQLALTAARQIIGQTPLCDASGVLQQIQQLIHQDPLFSGSLQLRVNPQDLPLVQRHLGVQLEQQGWKLLADTQLHRGGCKLSAEGGELDASIATRWQELCKLAAPELPL
ncbi:flagellar assembly protein FliH [Edwardsiella ictaluri]|uniref:flagellar assembly protein FliH n=1 Tax=Edwardsiella ictaluri TaxID=67780 RepID=UPI003784300B